MRDNIDRLLCSIPTHRCYDCADCPYLKNEACTFIGRRILTKTITLPEKR